MLSDESINEINRYTSPYSCLFVNSKGDLIRVYCPFVVTCVLPLPDIPIHRKVNVLRVKASLNDKIIYLIGKKYYLHTHFRYGI